MTQGSLLIDSSSNLLYKTSGGTPVQVVSSGGIMNYVPLKESFPLVSGDQDVNINTYTSIGVRSFDPSAIFDSFTHLTRTITFKAIVSCTSGVSLSILLYDLTGGSAVSGTTLTSSSNTPEEVSATLTPGGNIQNSNRLYEVQLKITVPVTAGASDRATCKSAEIQVAWAVT